MSGSDPIIFRLSFDIFHLSFLAENRTEMRDASVMSSFGPDSRALNDR